MIKSLLLSASLLALASTASAEVTLTVNGAAGDWVSQGQDVAITDADGTFSYRLDQNGTHFGLSATNFDAGWWWYLDMETANDDVMVPGVYLNAVRYPFNDLATPGVSWSGSGRGCNTLSGSFTVLDINVNEAGVLDYFHATFTQSCETWMPEISGEVLIDDRPAVVPFDFTFTVDPQVDTSRQGPAIVQGDVTCNAAGEVTLSGVLSQARNGWKQAEGSFEVTVPCDEASTAWQAEVYSTGRNFRSGTGDLSIIGTATDPVSGDEVSHLLDTPVTITLQR